MPDRFNLTQSLTCAACGDVLIDPITLSCGYSVCSPCFPITSPTSVKKSVFHCPVPHCDSATHLFALTDILKGLLSSSQPSSTQVKHSADSIVNAVIPHLSCQICSNPVSDPVTAPCGDTFCRLCILQSKINADACHTCSRPLPRFSSLSSQPCNQLIARIVKDFQLLGELPSNTRESLLLDTDHTHQYNVPLFISGAVIIPGQTFRLPIFAPNHLRMFREAIIPSSRYNGLCLAAVHRSRPQVAQFGTILHIIGLERRHDALMVDVVGIDRFRLDTHHEEEHESRLIASFEILHESAIRQLSIELPSDHDDAVQHVNAYAVDLADSILKYIQHLGSVSSIPSHVLHAQTAGLLGPLWFESVKSLHGPMPSKLDPVAVCWWAAVVLPMPPNDLYSLLRTIPIIDRLELIISWLQGFQSQWEKCRGTAIHAYSQVAGQ
ncbi:LON peptidase N-terminal domain and RING finger protein 3 [Rhizopus stolonifer]|uniref:LON peptidase N-terminal domain and RING finger protein 3 n=1 Tax=Rhizopus stolonifer TaxID=4846 RepID=A0A367KWX6_RHIST|nr:LON peptidase N-terminal domain and RING finger protein 3 [Rhizopus stolonifer]